MYTRALASTYRVMLARPVQLTRSLYPAAGTITEDEDSMGACVTPHASLAKPSHLSVDQPLCVTKYTLLDPMLSGIMQAVPALCASGR